MTENATNARDMKHDAQGRYAMVNGLNLYYEVHGTGSPLVLLHGGLGTVDMFEQLLPVLAKDRQVIAVELQAHGHTADIERPLAFESMADDVAALITHLGLTSADILGYSLGGGVTLQTAIRHPDVVRKLIIVSAPCKRDGWYTEDLAGMSAMTAEVAAGWIGSPMQSAYASAAPRPDDWPALVGKLGELLRQDSDWSSGVAAITAPTLIVAGDADGVRLDHAVEFYRLLGGGKAVGFMDPLPHSQLAVLPGTTHYTVLNRVDLLAAIIPPFLATPMPAAT